MTTKQRKYQNLAVLSSIVATILYTYFTLVSHTTPLDYTGLIRNTLTGVFVSLAVLFVWNSTKTHNSQMYSYTMHFAAFVFMSIDKIRKESNKYLNTSLGFTTLAAVAHTFISYYLTPRMLALDGVVRKGTFGGTYEPAEAFAETILFTYGLIGIILIFAVVSAIVGVIIYLQNPENESPF